MSMVKPHFTLTSKHKLTLETYSAIGDSPRRDNDGCCVHFKGLAYRTDERDLRELCEKHGNVVSVKIIYDPRTGIFHFSCILTFQAIRVDSDS